jgi:hypothetical protein
MIEFSYGGLTAQQYTLKVWLLNRGPWYCASSQWCEATYIIDNSDGTNPNGKFQVVKNMDVSAYAHLDWVARLYNSNGSQIAWNEHYLNGISNRPPVLSDIPDQNILLGETVIFQANATDPEGSNISYSVSNLPTGASFTAGALFEWSPLNEGTYTISVHANDGQTYDSQKMTMNVGPMADVDISLTSYPECGNTANITGIISGTTHYENYKVITYIFIDGYGWVTKPFTDTPKTPINTDGTFEIDITTGGIDDLAEIIYIGVCRNNADIPVVQGGDLPETLPVLDSVRQKREMCQCHRVIEWSGYSWWVKNSRMGKLGPGLNFFSDAPQNVFVDDDGNLHLKIINENGYWKCSEIVSIDTFGYGIYEFELLSGPAIDKNIVLGLFTWENDVSEEYNREIDIEFSNWGDDENKIAQYVIQPWHNDGNLLKFDMPIIEAPSIHLFHWEPDKIQFQSFCFSGSRFTAEEMISEWLYTGNGIPTTSQENVRLNLWIVDGNTPSDNQEQEVVVKRFMFRTSANNDFNGDGDVDGSDLVRFIAGFTTVDLTTVATDFGRADYSGSLASP